MMQWGVYKRDAGSETLVARFPDQQTAKADAFERTHRARTVHIARPVPDAPSDYFPGPGRAATSRHAYRDVIEGLPDRAQNVYHFVADRPLGANEYEIETEMHILHQSVSSITLILRRKGLLIPLVDAHGDQIVRPSRTKGHTGVVYVAVSPDQAKPDPDAGVNLYKRAVFAAYRHLNDGDVEAARRVLARVIGD